MLWFIITHNAFSLNFAGIIGPYVLEIKGTVKPTIKVVRAIFDLPLTVHLGIY